MYLCSDHTDPWEGKGTEGEVQQGKGSLTFTIRLCKHNYPSDEGLYTEAQADGGAVLSNDQEQTSDATGVDVKTWSRLNA